MLIGGYRFEKLHFRTDIAKFCYSFLYITADAIISLHHQNNSLRANRGRDGQKQNMPLCVLFLQLKEISRCQS